MTTFSHTVRSQTTGSGIPGVIKLLTQTMHYEGQITQKHHTIGLFHPLNRDKLVTFEGNNSFLLKLQTCSHFSESQWQVQQRLGDNRSATLGFRFGRHDGGHLRIWHWCYDVLKKSEMLVLVEVQKSMQKISLFFLFLLNVCLILKGQTKKAERPSLKRFLALLNEGNGFFSL